MNKHVLQSKIKSTGTAYLLWFFLGAHFAYLGKWALQIVYWIVVFVLSWVTLGVPIIWVIVEAIMMSKRVEKYNASIYEQIEQIEKKEKEDDLARNMAIIHSAKA